MWLETMRWVLKDSSTALRHADRLNAEASVRAEASARVPVRMNPVTPSVTISGTDPAGDATAGGPQAEESIITSPKGSGHFRGLSIATASPRRAYLSRAPSSPM